MLTVLSNPNKTCIEILLNSSIQNFAGYKCIFILTAIQPYKFNMTVYNLGVLAHFAPWGIFGLGY